MTFERDLIPVWPTGYLAEDLLAHQGWWFSSTVLAHVLLVGVKSTRERPFYDSARAFGGRVTIVEPFAPNARWARENYPEAEVHQNTVHEWLRVAGSASVTLAVWLQGPEHVAREEALYALNALRLDGRAGVIAEMPHGIHEQGPDGGNDYETHRGHLYPHDFDPAIWQVAVGPTALPREQSPHQNVHLLVWSRPHVTP